MNVSWDLAHEAMRCRVEWSDGQLFWQVIHPYAPNGQTRPAPVSELAVDGRPAQWTRLIDAQETHGPDAAPRLAVTVADSSGRLRLVRHFELFAGHAFARTWGVVERTGADDGEPPLIDGAAILHLAVDAGRAITLVPRRAV